MSIKFKKQPKVVIDVTEKLYNDLLSLVNSTDLEMTLILELEKTSKYSFKIINYLIPPQWNESAESKTLDSKYPQWCVEQIKKQHKLNGHMHSHPKFSVTPSGYDNTFFNNLVDETNTYQARFIINQRGFITADIINEEDNYIAEECDIRVLCNNFNIIVNAKSVSAEVDFDHLSYENISVNRNLTVSLHSKFLTLNATSISYTKTVEYKPVRKNDTDEGYFRFGNTSNYTFGFNAPKYQQNTFPEDDDDEEIPYQHNLDPQIYDKDFEEDYKRFGGGLTREEYMEFLMQMEDEENELSK